MDTKTETRGAGASAGKPNGRTTRAKKLKAMSPTQRKEHRKTWRAAAKALRKGKPVAAASAAAPAAAKGKPSGKPK